MGVTLMPTIPFPETLIGSVIATLICVGVDQPAWAAIGGAATGAIAALWFCLWASHPRQ